MIMDPRRPYSYRELLAGDSTRARLVMDPAGPRCDEADLAALELACETRFPEDYRAFLLAWNGGVPSRAGVPLKDSGDVIDYLYSVGASYLMRDLHARYLALRGIVPAGHLAIGGTCTGSLIVLCFAPGEQPGAVLHLTTTPRENRKLRLRFVAPTFSAFLAKLVEA